jgi:hypothetical protein
LPRAAFHSLLTSGLSQSELLIVFYLIDMCNDWGFTTQTKKSIARFFNADLSNISKRVKKLIELDIIKIVEYNGRSGFMVNPDYCYQGALHLRRFRARLWIEEKVYTSRKPDRFYGPPVVEHSEQGWKNRAIVRDRSGRFAHIKHVSPPPSDEFYY